MIYNDIFIILFSALVDLAFIKNYSSYRGQFIKKGRGNTFTNAVKELEDYMSDRVVCLETK